MLGGQCWGHTGRKNWDGEEKQPNLNYSPSFAFIHTTNVTQTNGECWGLQIYMRTKQKNNLIMTLI